MADPVNTPNDAFQHKRQQQDTKKPAQQKTERFNIEALKASLPNFDCQQGDLLRILKVKTANQWLIDANAKPIPKMLFDEFWFEGELCILFSDTNLGKSILAVQIADSISKGAPILGLAMDAQAQQVLVFDFELSEKQFEDRYSRDYQNHYPFNDRLLRVEIDPDSEIPDGASEEELMNKAIENAIIQTQTKVLIVDNITYLRTETEKAKDALPLMKYLKKFRIRYGLSILALAHTPKRDHFKPITNNDLQGSKMLINFCDSAFAIGQSHIEDGLRYLKQIKVRAKQFKYPSDNICVCEIKKPENMVQFEFKGFGYEKEHLKQRSEKELAERKRQAQEMRANGMSNVQIALKFGVTEGAVRKWWNT